MRQLAAAAAAALLLVACGEDPATGPDPEVTSYAVGGHDLWGRCSAGDGETPTVVYLHGLDSNASVFLPLVEEVEEHVPGSTQCAFDRVNAGESEDDPRPRPLQSSVSELRGFLDQAGVEGPVVLVGASYGGLVALGYAGRYPGDVRALVLADAPLPFETALYDAALRERIRTGVADNDERVDLLASYAAAAKVTVPDVPVVYVDAVMQDLPTEIGAKGYRPALKAYLRSLPQGRLVLSRSDHLGVVSSRELVDAVLAQLG